MTFDLEQGRIAVAYLYKRKGSVRLNRNEIYAYVVMDLKWLDAEGVNTFIDNCLRSGLLIEVEPNVYSPNFDVGSVDVDLKFTPTSALTEPYVVKGEGGDGEVGAAMPFQEVEGAEGANGEGDVGKMRGDTGVSSDTGMGGTGGDKGEVNVTDSKASTTTDLGEKDPYIGIVGDISSKTWRERSEVLKEIEAFAREMGLYPEAAALLYAAINNVSIDPWVPGLEEKLMDRIQRECGGC